MSNAFQLPTQKEYETPKLQESTKFLKSGDFFAYIENMVHEDVEQSNEPNDYNDYKVKNLANQHQMEESNLLKNDMEISHARSFEVEMNHQSRVAGMGQQKVQQWEKKVPAEVITEEEEGPLRDNFVMKDEMISNQVDYEQEYNDPSPEYPDDHMDEPISKTNQFTNRNNFNDLRKSSDERIIKSKKKTFEEMLEEALKKEGKPYQPVQEENEEAKEERRANFLKKNTSKRRFLKRKNNNNKAKQKNKDKLKQMTDSMLEFEKIEQKHNDDIENIDTNNILHEEIPEESTSIQEDVKDDANNDESDDDIDYKYLNMNKQQPTRSQNSNKKVSALELRTEVQKVRKEVENTFKKKIENLNVEIRKYKHQNKLLEEEKKRISKAKKKLEEEKIEAEKLRNEMDDFKNYREKELEKIKREKAMTKRNAKAYRANVSKKDK
jgi:hypothetical protein